MKVSGAIIFCLQYHKINSRPNTVKNYRFLLAKFKTSFKGREIESVTTEEIISFLADLTEGRKQNTKRGSLYNYVSFLQLD